MTALDPVGSSASAVASTPAQLAERISWLDETERELIRSTEGEFYMESMEVRARLGGWKGGPLDARTAPPTPPTPLAPCPRAALGAPTQVLAEAAKTLPAGTSAATSMPMLSNLGHEGARVAAAHHHHDSVLASVAGGHEGHAATALPAGTATASSASRAVAPPVPTPASSTAAAASSSRRSAAAAKTVTSELQQQQQQQGGAAAPAPNPDAVYLTRCGAGPLPLGSCVRKLAAPVRCAR